MFTHLSLLPADPILGLMTQFRRDQNPHKVDLGVGIYKDEAGNTPVMAAVKQAQHRIIGSEQTKAYIGPSGNARYCHEMSKLLLGESSTVLAQDRLVSVQTPGGCGALRVAAELIKSASPEACIWVSSPTWGNHIPLLGGAGIEIKEYAYLDASKSALDFDGMVADLSKAQRGDLVLLHGCCHNPTGVDLTEAQWKRIAELANQIGFVPFVDLAYQGFGDGLDEDVVGLRILAENLPEVLIAVSCSKNFGLYRERVGLLSIVTESFAAKQCVESHVLSLVRGIYSMPPNFGAEIVAEILSDKALRDSWQSELDGMRIRINSLRCQFSDEMSKRGDKGRFAFVSQQKGMFSYLGLSKKEVTSLVNESSIYILESSRASIAGLNQGNLELVCKTIMNLINESR